MNLSGCLPSIVYARHGVCVTSAGFIVHWSQLDSDTSVWNHMCLDLEIENYAMVYTSKLVKKLCFGEDKARDKRILLD